MAEGTRKNSATRLGNLLSTLKNWEQTTGIAANTSASTSVSTSPAQGQASPEMVRRAVLLFSKKGEEEEACRLALEPTCIFTASCPLLSPSLCLLAAAVTWHECRCIGCKSRRGSACAGRSQRQARHPTAACLVQCHCRKEGCALHLNQAHSCPLSARHVHPCSVKVQARAIVHPAVARIRASSQVSLSFP